MSNIKWERYPRVAKYPQTRSWLSFQANRGLASNTIQAYGRAVEDYLRFCEKLEISANTATREHIARYIRDLNERPIPPNVKARSGEIGVGLSNATLHQRLTAIRLYYDYLVEDGHREANPVGRGRYAPRNPSGGKRSLVPTYHRLPWISNDEEWRTILEVTRSESIRNRFMFALAYDAGLRREELCRLETGDIDPSRRMLTIRAENTKNRRARVVPYSEATGVLYMAYLGKRRELGRERGLLFLSESRRNKGQPISIWTWSKVVKGIAQRAGLDRFTTHTLRHLCLTDLARAGWDIHEIALFAGHRSTQTTLLYIHLSGRELADKLQSGMNQIHTWRVNMMKEMLP